MYTPVSPRLIALLFSVFYFLPFSYNQTPCDSNPAAPFALSSSTTFCAEADGPTTILFTIFNTGSPGTYEVLFPDGTDTTIVDLEISINISREFNFDCENMPGDPNPPTSSNNFFSYQNEVQVTRTDCVDALGQLSVGFYNFNVVPNPINGFTVATNTDCMSAPFLVDFNSDICDDDLVETYQWYIDNDPIPAPVGNEADLEDYAFPGPGTYTVRLEVSDYFNCGPYSFEQDLTITVEPDINVNISLDSSQLCLPIFEVLTLNASVYADSYLWSSPDNVTFSDPTSPNPVITVNNDQAGTYQIILEATNAECGTVSQTFSIETFSEQAISVVGEVVACTDTPINLCDYIDYEPNPSSVVWSSSNPGFTIDDPAALCPEISFSEAGDWIVTVTGFDICESPFSEDVPIAVTPTQTVVIDLPPIDTLCETDPMINLLDLVSPSSYIVECQGDGVVDCEFVPADNLGLTTVTFVDSCGSFYDYQFFVTAEGGFSGGTPVLCIGDSLDLFQIQPGSYDAPQIIDNVFYSEGLPAGAYPISFTSDAFCGGTGSFEIQVVEIPAADFLIATPSCVVDQMIFPLGSTIDLENLSLGTVECYTILETGEEICNSENASFTFDQSGEYTLQQIVGLSNAGCQDTITQSILIEPEFAPDFAVTVDSTNCDSLFISFLADTLVADYSYTWTFSDGSMSTQANPTIAVERPFVPSLFTANLEITTYCGSVPFTFELDLPARFQVSFDILNDNDSSCSGETVYFQNTSTNYDSLSVTFGDITVSNEFLDSLVFQNTSDTIQWIPIVLEGFRENCPPRQVIDTLILYPLNTTAQFSFNWDGPPCSPFVVTLMNSSTPGSTNTVYWGDGSTPESIGTLAEVEHQFLVANDTTITVTLVSELCGRDTISKELTILASPTLAFDYFPLSAQCVGDSILFVPAGAIAPSWSFDWQFGDTNGSQQLEPIHQYAEAGNYTALLTVTDEDGCQTVLDQTLTIQSYSGEELLIAANNYACVDEVLALQLISAETEVFIDYGNNFVATEIDAFSYDQPGEYQLTVSSIDENGCSQDTSLLIQVVPPIEVFIIPDSNTIVRGLGDLVELDFMALPDRALSFILWEGDSILFKNTKETVGQAIDHGLFHLTIVDQFGCQAEDEIFVQVNKNYESAIYVPNAFTPDNDGANDYFYIFAKDNTVANIHSFRIFDRWGQMVHEKEDIQPNDILSGWDGRLDGAQLNPQVLVWIAEIEFVDGIKATLSGDLHLLR